MCQEKINATAIFRQSAQTEIVGLKWKWKILKDNISTIKRRVKKKKKTGANILKKISFKVGLLIWRTFLKQPKNLAKFSLCE